MSAAQEQETAYEKIHIETWGQYVRLVSRARFSTWAFRGHSDARWGLETTLARRFTIAKIDRRVWPAQEHRILTVFKRKAHLFLEHIPEDDDSFRWLAMMQHHGAPTRLLDFTWSPYVAAFFALENASADVAAVWAVNQPALRSTLPATGGGKFNPEHVWPRDKGNYERYFIGNRYSFVVIDSPDVMNERLIAQSGVFLIPGTIHAPVESILSHYPNPREVLVKFILNTETVRETAMRELYQMNVTHYTLFPGLDGLARSMGYETEYNRKFDPRTTEPKPGWEAHVGRATRGSPPDEPSV